MLGIDGNRFTLNGVPALLRGVGLGNWLNLEHFLIGIPGAEQEIRRCVLDRYGPEAAEAFWRRYFGRSVGEADLRYLRRLGFNSIRVPVNHRLFPTTGRFEDAPAVRELDRVIELCGRNDLVCIIDLHAAPGGQNPDWHSDNITGDYEFWRRPAHRARAVSLWGDLAARYAACPALGGYDLVNEPCYFEPELDAVLTAFSEECTRAIRRFDTDHIIFLEGNTYSRDFSMFTEPSDDRIAYTFHYYPFLQIAAELSKENIGEVLRESLFSDVTLHHLQDLGRPLWCGETGHPHHLPASLPALKTYLELLESLDISWALWPYKDARAMGIVSPPKEGRWMRLVKRLSGWSFWDIFNEDSILAADRAGDKKRFYKRLAEESTRANRRFGENLAAVSFEELMAAVDDWGFEVCEENGPLVDLIRQLPRPGTPLRKTKR